MESVYRIGRLMSRWLDILGAMIVVLALAAISHAQNAVDVFVPNAPPDVTGAAGALVQALHAKEGWLALAGLVLGLVIQLLKTDWGFGLLAGAPSWVRFWIPFAVGAVAGIVDKVVHKGDWALALVDTLLIALPAITARKGAESHGVEKVLPTAEK